MTGVRSAITGAAPIASLRPCLDMRHGEGSEEDLYRSPEFVGIVAGGYRAALVAHVQLWCRNAPCSGCQQVRSAVMSNEHSDNMDFALIDTHVRTK